MYKTFIKPILFLFDPENIHHTVFKTIKIIHLIPGINIIIRFIYKYSHPGLQRNIFSLKFQNPVGLAAGFDKDAKLYKELNNFGFGFIEIGTVTPKSQLGNTKKRLFRLKKDSALINRMGFNNDGVLKVVDRLRNNNNNVIIGGNIGKNKFTPNDKAVDDYNYCFDILFDYVDYFVVNVSSPNTPNLRDLQEKKPLTLILESLQNLNSQKKERKPILLKISPDLSKNELLDIIDIVNLTKIDGVIATNTTLDRNGLISKNKNQNGGLSGKPLCDRSTEVIKFLSEKSNKKFTIIGVGGIHSAEDAIKKINAGADLIQLYTGFIYEGPSLVKEINKAIAKI